MILGVVTEIVGVAESGIDEGEIDVLQRLVGQLRSKTGTEKAVHVGVFELALREHECRHLIGPASDLSSAYALRNSFSIKESAQDGQKNEQH